MKPAISLPVYFKSVKIWKYVLREKKQQQQKDQKKKKKHFQQWELNPRPPTWKVNMTVIYCATTTSIENPP